MWEFRSSLDDGIGTSGIVWTLECVDPREELRRHKESLEAEGCDVRPVIRHDSSYVLTAECGVHRDDARTVESAVSVESDTAYRLREVESSAGKLTVEALRAKRVGDC